MFSAYLLIILDYNMSKDGKNLNFKKNKNHEFECKLHIGEKKFETDSERTSTGFEAFSEKEKLARKVRVG